MTSDAGDSTHGHAHDHSHAHGAGHSHGGHGHAPADFGKAFAIGIALNITYVVVEAAYGFFGNSLALLVSCPSNT